MSSKFQAIAATLCLAATATDIRAQVYCYPPAISGPPMLSSTYQPTEPGRPFCVPQCSPEQTAEYARALVAYHRQLSDYTYRLEQHARDVAAYHASATKATAEYARCLEQRDFTRR
jgi:hypothetical protein